MRWQDAGEMKVVSLALLVLGAFYLYPAVFPFLSLFHFLFCLWFLLHLPLPSHCVGDFLSFLFLSLL